MTMSNEERGKIEDIQTRALGLVEQIHNASFNNMLWNDIGGPVNELKLVVWELAEV